MLDKTYVDVKTKILCMDKEGYYIYIMLNNFFTRRGIGRRFDKTNDYTIDNINHYLQIHNVHFKCISDKFINANTIMKFQCLLCGEIVESLWRNVNKNDNPNRYHVICPNCDGRNESIHALVLKQLFLHYYPDTVVEEKSYRNPNTNKICPTDIVNHRLKIAIEIQSQWHDFDNIKEKDKMKKKFWLSKGYSFFDPDIRDYSVLQISQIFFDITELPDWIDYNYSNKINIKVIQTMLNNGKTIPEIAKELQINKHRLYDAVYSKKLFYPQNYIFKNAIKQNYIL